MAIKKKLDENELKLSGPLKDVLPNRLFAIGGIGLLISLFFAVKDPHHFFSSYLTSFVFFMTLTLGAMFFVLMQHISRAGWSVVVRRIPEVLMKNIPLMGLLFVPILFGMHDLYHWTHHDAVAADHLLQGKAPYLNIPFFIIRALVFFGVWHFISNRFFSKSVEQDTSGDGTATLNLQKSATFSIILFALTLTFAFVDWVMSLTPHWYSTIFGVYFFAGAMVVVLAVMSLLFMILRKRGFLANVVTVEHYHDMGKFLYGFNVFWTYIAFSQYFLIWYANIPEETVWFAEHFHGSWNSVAILLAVGHFAIPFLLFMSRHVKRNLKTHAMMAIWLVFIHFVDMYWIIMPNISPEGVHVTVSDVVAFIGIGGIYFGAFFKRLSSVLLVPAKDPRIDESISFTNA